MRKVVADGAAIVGLRGMGGVGKTSLALVLAHELTAAYPDAQVFIEMRGLDAMPTTPRAAMEQVIHAFEGPEAKLPDDWAELLARYHAALNGKKALLLFDNALDDQQVQPLLPQISCLSIVTSRHVCYLPGLMEYPLGAMTADDAHALLLRITPRIGAEADAIAAMCARLPLALTLAGKWVREHRALAPGIWLNRCQDVSARLKLTGMDAVLQVSYEALREYADADLQAAWRVLAIFPGSFDVDGAAAVWGLWEGADSAERAQAARETAEERMSALDNASLVEYDAQSGRFSLHDLAREFARGKLGDDEREAAGRRHAEYYIQVLATADDLYIDGNEGIGQGLVLFDRERENIEAGQAWAAARAEQDGATARLSERYCGWGWSVLTLRLNRREHISWLEQALAAARYLNDQRTEAAHLGSLGEAYAELGETDRAIVYHKQALAIVKAIKIWYGEVHALGNLGSDYNLLGEPLRAIDYLEEALVIARGHRDQRGEGNTLGKLGDAFANLREPRRAIEYYEQALAINREIPDKRAEGTILGSLGIAYAALSETDLAIKFYGQSLDIAREIGDRRGEGNARWNIALALDTVGEREKAIVSAEAALKIYEAIEDPNEGRVRRGLEEWKAEAGA